MKKGFVFLLCLICLISFSACFDATTKAPEDAPAVEQEEQAKTPKTEKPVLPAESKAPDYDAGAIPDDSARAIPEEYFQPEPTPPKITEEKVSGGVLIRAVSQPDPVYGISLILPSDWTYQSERFISDGVGIEIKPDGEGIFGPIMIWCKDSFGVCGTGLTCEDIVFHGHPASRGTYDGSTEWDYISFKGTKGCAIINETQGWYADYAGEIDQILSTVEFMYPDA